MVAAPQATAAAAVENGLSWLGLTGCGFSGFYLSQLPIAKQGLDVLIWTSSLC